jgi:hypothetical protein
VQLLTPWASPQTAIYSERVPERDSLKLPPQHHAYAEYSYPLDRPRLTVQQGASCNLAVEERLKMGGHSLEGLPFSNGGRAQKQWEGVATAKLAQKLSGIRRFMKKLRTLQ